VTPVVSVQEFRVLALCHYIEQELISWNMVNMKNVEWNLKRSQRIMSNATKKTIIVLDVCGLINQPFYKNHRTTFRLDQTRKRRMNILNSEFPLPFLYNFLTTFIVSGHCPSSCFCLKHSDSKTAFCFRPQVEPTQFGPIDRATAYLPTPAPTQDRSITA
jgi:hypothetical protein